MKAESPPPFLAGEMDRAFALLGEVQRRELLASSPRPQAFVLCRTLLKGCRITGDARSATVRALIEALGVSGGRVGKPRARSPGEGG